MTIEKLIQEKRLFIIARIVREAPKHKIKMEIISERNAIIKFSKGSNSFYTIGNDLPFCKKYPPAVIENKDATKELLSTQGLCVPKGVCANSYTDLRRQILKESLSFPLILKPIDGLRSIGITWDISSFNQLRHAVCKLKKIQKDSLHLKSNFFIAEEQFEGDEFRVLILGGKLIACVKKIPATVIGDGAHSISQLITLFNTNRKKKYHMIIDDTVNDYLARQKKSLKYIPSANQHVKLRNDMMLSHGGRAIDYTQKISSSLRNICISSAHAAGLDYVGIDILVKKGASKNISSGEYVIIELNTFPAYVLNEAPLAENATVDVSSILLNYFLTH